MKPRSYEAFSRSITEATKHEARSYLATELRSMIYEAQPWRWSMKHEGQLLANEGEPRSHSHCTATLIKHLAI
jgi:hypothetical protein